MSMSEQRQAAWASWMTAWAKDDSKPWPPDPQALYDAGAAWQAEHEPKLWSCPECAFTFDAMHTEQDGSYSCPACAEQRLRVSLEACVTALDGLWDEALEDDDETRRQCAAAIAQARAALAATEPAGEPA